MRQLIIDESPHPAGDDPLIIEPHRCYQIQDPDGDYTVQVTGIGEATVYGMSKGHVVTLEHVRELANEGRIRPVEEPPQHSVSG